MSYKLVNKNYQKISLEFINFNMTFCPYYLTTQPNLIVENYNQFKRQILNDIVKYQKSLIENERTRENSEEEKWYKYSLEYLGELKFRQELERLYCTSLIGQWNTYYIKLCPYYIDDKPHHAQVEFDHIHSILELLYAHNQIWNDFYRNETNYNVNKIADKSHNVK